MFRALSEDKILKREARLFLRDLNPPDVVTANVYFWRPRGNEGKILKEVYQWLEDLNLRLGLGLTIEREDNTIRVFKNDQELAYFSYYESRRNVYRHQDFKELLSYIEQRMAGKPIKTLSKDEEILYQELSKFLGVSWDDSVARKMIIEQWDFFISIASKIKFRDEYEIREFLRTIKIDKLRTEGLRDLLNYINILNITNYKKLPFIIYMTFRELVPLELLIELAKVIEEKNLNPERVRRYLETRGELRKYPEVYKIFIEFLRNTQTTSDLEIWSEVVTYNPTDLEFIKGVFSLDWSGLIRLLSGLSKDEDLRRRFHRAVKIRSRRVMEEVYSEVIGRKLVGRLRGGVTMKGKILKIADYINELFQIFGQKEFKVVLDRWWAGKPKRGYRYWTDGKSVYYFNSEVLRRLDGYKVEMNNQGYTTATTRSIFNTFFNWAGIDAGVFIKSGRFLIKIGDEIYEFPSRTWVPIDLMTKKFLYSFKKAEPVVPLSRILNEILTDLKIKVKLASPNEDIGNIQILGTDLVLDDLIEGLLQGRHIYHIITPYTRWFTDQLTSDIIWTDIRTLLRHKFERGELNIEEVAKRIGLM